MAKSKNCGEEIVKISLQLFKDGGKNNVKTLLHFTKDKTIWSF